MDIFGWVEKRQGGVAEKASWTGVLRVNPMVGRDRDAFWCLFGVGHSIDLQPVVPFRGIPHDISREALADVLGTHVDAGNSMLEIQRAFDDDPGLFGATFLTVGEIRNIDLGERSTKVDDLLHEYRRTAEGDYAYVGRAIVDGRVAALLNIPLSALQRNGLELHEGQIWYADGSIFIAERLSRRQVLGESWQTLFGIMEMIAQSHGDDGVRLTVWFGN